MIDQDAPLRYQYFRKERIGEGQSVEDLKELTQEDYDELYKGVVRELEKVRVSFRDTATGFVYEVDQIHFDEYERTRVDLLVLEIEFQDHYSTMEEVDANFKLPQIIQDVVLVDVTGLDSCSNWSLAQEL